MSERPTGILVYPMPEEVNGPTGDHYALLVRYDGEMRMVHSEGVAYVVSDEKPWCWTDFDPTQHKFTPAELLELRNKSCDLSIWIREFGARLESNFGMIHGWAVGIDW